MNRFRLTVAAIAAALLAIVLSACASLPPTTPGERVARDAATCLQNGPCVVLQIDNQSYYDAVVRLNGSLVGRVAGNHGATLFIRESALVDGGCAQVSLYFRQIERMIWSSKECLRPGGHFTLAVDPLYHAWLTPGGGR